MRALEQIAYDPQTDYRPRSIELPDDVCESICKAVRNLPRMVAATTLLSLSLVSQTWSRAAQVALHADPFLCFDAPDTIPPRTYERLSMLLRTLETRPDLSRSVRCLDLGVYTTRCQTEARVDRRRVSQLAIDLVRAAPALHSLSLPFVTQADKPHLVDALRELDCLETLTIGEGTSSPDPWVINVDIGIKDQWGCARWFREDFVPLCQHWPRLRKVNLQARLRNRDKDDVVGVPWRLEAFELSLHRHGRLGFAQVDRLLHGCRAATLRRLHIKEHQLADGALDDLLGTYGSGLISLTTLTADHFTHHDTLFPTIADACLALETLYLATPVYDFLSNLQNLLRLPRLRELTLATAVAPVVPPVDLVARLAVLIGESPKLEVIAVGPGTHHVIDRMNTIYFTRALAETAKTLELKGRARLTVLPSWGPV